MNKSTIYQRMQFQNEFESLVWQMMTRVKRGETIPDVGKYQRVRAMLKQRAEYLLSSEEMSLENESDWLALALYAEDRRFFAQLCLHAESHNDPVYHNASRWLGKLFQSTIESYGTNA